VLGTDPDVDVDTITVDTRSGDLFLLCSDGLYSMVGNDRILELVERNRRDLDAAAKALIAAANKGGGDDNITVVAFEIVPDGEAAPAAPEPALDEEETLDESDQVPTVKLPPEEEPEPAVGPKPPKKVLALLAVLILAIAASIVIYLLVR
jgi:serine/threonine protein phosphatase PrpC